MVGVFVLMCMNMFVQTCVCVTICLCESIRVFVCVKCMCEVCSCVCTSVSMQMYMCVCVSSWNRDLLVGVQTDLLLFEKGRSNLSINFTWEIRHGLSDVFSPLYR